MKRATARHSSRSNRGCHSTNPCGAPLHHISSSGAHADPRFCASAFNNRRMEWATVMESASANTTKDGTSRSSSGHRAVDMKSRSLITVLAMVASSMARYRMIRSIHACCIPSRPSPEIIRRVISLSIKKHTGSTNVAVSTTSLANPRTRRREIVPKECPTKWARRCPSRASMSTTTWAKPFADGTPAPRRMLTWGEVTTYRSPCWSWPKARIAGMYGRGPTPKPWKKTRGWAPASRPRRR
mmetsp:Transcript_50543/g.133169  ORF Transcript_50543/g.133169 Transcript_50543/m.133169 type:complete len:241 (+) Transcript_50543:158-880(+)